MEVYGGIDLHSNNSVVSVIDEHDRVVAEKRLPNELERILLFLAAFKRALDIQVKAVGEDGAAPQRTIKALAGLYTDWKKPAQAAAYTARLKPADTKPPAGAPAK